MKIPYIFKHKNRPLELFLTLLTLFAPIFSKAQSVNDAIKQYLPINNKQSPEVAAFAKFIEIPVSHYTGTPNVGIPIYTLRSKMLSVPISLNYHASGVRVEEEASQVGLGWSLDVGGMISRSVRGRDDFDGLFRTNNSDQDGLNTILMPSYGISPSQGNVKWQFSNGPTGPTNPSVSLFFFCDTQQTDQLVWNTAKKMVIAPASALEVGKPALDGQPDMFSFKAGSYSGKFILTKEQMPFKVYVQSQDPIKIEILATTPTGPPDMTGNSGFKITTPDGTQYFYQQKEYTKSIGGTSRSGKVKYQELVAGVGNNDAAYMNVNWDNYIDYIIPYISAWYLTKVVSGSNDSELATITYDVSTAYTLPLPNRIQNISYPQNVNNWRVTDSRQQNVSINSITTTFGSINFEKSNRLDIRAQVGAEQKRIDRIVVKDQFAQQVMAFKLNYGYFDSGSGQPDHVSKRLRLESVVQQGSDNTNQPPYAIIYHDKVANQLTALPDKNSYAQDFWGYYNGQNNNNTKTNVQTGNNPGVFAVNNGTMVPANLKVAPLWDFNDPANRDANIEYARLGTLSSMTYPTGGKLELDYELHEFNNYTSNPEPNSIKVSNSVANSVIMKGAGLRIKATKLYSNIADVLPSIQHKYDYPLTFMTSGKLMYDMSFSYIVANPGGGSPYQVFSSGTKYPLSQSANGNPVGYSRVVETQTNAADNSTNGYTEYVFDNTVDTRYDTFCFSIDQTIGSGSVCNQPGYILPYVPCGYYYINNNNVGGATGIFWDKLIFENEAIPNSFSIRNGQLLSKTAYNASNQKVSEEINIYTSPANTLKQRIKALIAKGRLSGDPYPALYQYYIDTEWIKLEEKTSTSYFYNPVSSTTNYTKYEYSDLLHRQITRMVTVNSKNDSIGVSYKYPHNFLPGTTNIYQLMVQRNMIIPVIEQTSKNITNNAQLSKTTNTYLNFGTTALPLVFLERTTSAIGTYNETVPDAIFKYDSYGNMTEIMPRNNSPISFIWGYNDNYPVAQLSNMTAANTQTLLSSVGLSSTSFSTLSGTTDSQRESDLFSKFNTLRAGLTSQYPVSQLTGFTHKPLVGQSAQTDPNGRTMTYQYDTFNRLSKIYDHQSRLLKEFCYNISGQNIDCVSGAYTGAIQPTASKTLLDDNCTNIINRSAPVLAGQTQTDTACQKINILPGFSIAPGGTYNGLIQ